MAVTTAEDFLAVLQRSKLLGPEQFAAAQRAVEPGQDATALAKTLARLDLISRWQAGQLLAGRATLFLGKYKLIQLLGKGGMGSVFLAEHVTMNRRVALKIVSRQIGKDPASLQRFLTEARAVAALDHPNIVRAYDFDNVEERYFMVMEYVDGFDLQRMVEAEGPLDLAQAADYIRQAADGLAHAHARKIVHCDIKPSNLLLNNQGVVKILDMGLARLTGGESDAKPSDERVLGSVDYLSPEQALGGDFDHRVDIYSLGCTLYFVLTGHPPFPEGTLAQRIVRHQTEEPRELRQERPEVPVDLAAICHKMMAKQPGDRYQTAAEISRALGEWQPPARKPRPALPKIAQPAEEELPAADSQADLWWQSLLSTPAGTSSGVATVPGAAAAKSPGQGRPAAWSQPAGASGPVPGEEVAPAPGSRRRTVATVLMGLVVVALLVVTGLLVRQHLRGQPTEKTISGGQPKTEGGPAEEPPIVVPPPSDEKPTPSPEPKPKPGRRPRRPRPAPAKPAKVEPKPDTTAPKPSPEKPPEPKPTPKPQPEKPPEPKPTPKAAPEKPPEPKPVPKPETVKREKPLRDLAAAVDLPDLSGAEAAKPADRQQPVALGNIDLEPGTDLEIRLLGVRAIAKGNPRLSLVRKAADGQKDNWLVLAQGEATGGPAPAARIWLAEQALQIQWLQGAEEMGVDCLRNCGLVVSAGSESRFIALRTPQVVDPLPVDLDRPAMRLPLAIDSLPDPGTLRLQVTSLEGPFPKHEFRLREVAKRKTSELKPGDTISPEGQLFAIFSDQNLPKVGLVIDLEVKGRPPRLDVACAALYQSLAGPMRPFVQIKKVFANDKTVAQLKVRQQQLTAMIAAAKNDEFKKVAQQQLEAINARLAQITPQIEALLKLYDAIHKGGKVHFRVFAVLDDEHRVELFRTVSEGQEPLGLGKAR